MSSPEVPVVNTSLTLQLHVDHLIFNFRSTIWHHFPLYPLVHRKLAGVCVAVDTKDVAEMLPATVLAAPMLNRKSLSLIVVPQQADFALLSTCNNQPTSYTINMLFQTLL